MPVCRTDSNGDLVVQGGGNPIEFGGWALDQAGVKAGSWYRLNARFRAESVRDERREVIARIDWIGSNGERVGQPDYAFETTEDGPWRTVTLSVPAPAGSVRARIELLLAWSPGGSVRWSGVSLAPTTPPPPRPVRLGTVHLPPAPNGDNIGGAVAALDAIAADHPDIVCLGEEINMAGKTSYLDAAEPIPGPSTRRLGAAARRHSVYVVAGLTERDGPACYNTTVLIDRSGKLAGKYRKVYLPREEIEGGLTPGSECPVFDTDFGRIGIMVCWDAEYADPARALALKGAEVILVPAAGGYMTLLRARALENHLYVVSSGHDVESSIIDPTGAVLYQSLEPGASKVVAVDLSRRFYDDWLGDMRPRFHKELRTDLLPAGFH